MLRPAKPSDATLWDGLAPTLKARFDSLISKCDPEVQGAWNRSVVRPLEMFLRRPSKELRANLTRWGWSLGRADEPPDALLLLVELIHAGSLIMDDVQDDSRRRRGGRALHCAVGVPRALNAAASLYFLPLLMLEDLRLSDAVKLRLHRRMSEAMLACCHGQSLDVGTTVHEVQPSSLRAMVETATLLKTGRLMEFAAELGAVAAEVDDGKIRAAGALAGSIGFALQMLNDLCDLSPGAAPCREHEDLARRRPTWAWVWTYEEHGPSKYADWLRDLEAESGERAELAAMALRLHHSITDRARAEIQSTLRAAVQEWADLFGDGPELEAIVNEIRRLESAHCA